MTPKGADPRPAAHRSLALILPIGLMAAVLALIAPVPPLLLDLLLSANIAAAVVILLQTVQVRRPLEFSAFPALLLATTLSRLVLNVASTRLILTDAAATGVEAAGGVIAAFGEFVAAGSPIVGGVVFAILVTIQFLVITKGSGRISEVAARFALDGMPGRQAAVDADLTAGLITPAEARLHRDEIARQADFYGSMDGASKFVRGDAVAGLVITGVNICGGLAIGVLRDGLPVEEAVSIYTTLTIGDGLVSQVPAFLISLAAGLIVTRSSTETDLSGDVVGQMLGHPLPLWIASAFLAVLAFTGFPMIPLLALSGLCLAAGFRLAATTDAFTPEPVAPQARPEEQRTPTPASQQNTATATPLEQHLHVEPLELDLGVSLVRLADRSCGGDLLDRVSALRERIASDLGFIVPKVRIQDDLRLDPRQFRIKLRGVPVASGTLYADAVLAVNDGFVAEPLQGLEAVEPSTGRVGVWIEQAQGEAARELGYRLVPPQVVVLQTLEQVVRRHAGELLTREHVHSLLSHLRQRTPRLVEDLHPGRLSGGEIHRVLSELLSENVPIRDLEAILEALGDATTDSRSIEDLTAAVRIALRRTMLRQLSDSRGMLHVIVLDVADREALLHDSQLASTFQPGRGRLQQLIPWFGRLLDALQRLTALDHAPVVLCRNECRTLVRDLLRQAGISAVVLGHRELPPEVELRIHAELTTFDPSAASGDATTSSQRVDLTQAAQLSTTAH